MYMEMRAAQLSVCERGQPYELSNYPSVQNGVPGTGSTDVMLLR